MSTPPHGTRLRVILLPPKPIKALHEYPFACVVSQLPGEQMYNTTKPCLHVFYCEDDEPDFADGLYASHEETELIGDPVDWPVMSAALSREVKVYSKSLMPKAGELPFQRVMLWQEYGGHTNPPLADDAKGHAMLAFMAALKWNDWMKAATVSAESKRGEQWRFDDALRSVISRDEWAAIVAEGREINAGEAFRKWCGEIGLAKPHPTDFATPYNQLLDVLRTALKVHEGIRDEWARNGKP